MARKKDSQQDVNAPSRVYKQSDVHKRRVDRMGREKSASKQPEVATPVSPEPSSQETAYIQPSDLNGAPQDTAPHSAVVITPDFGKRTDAQREADDRWFAAMRETGVEPGSAGETTPADANEAVSAEVFASAPAEQPTQSQQVQPESQPELQPQLESQPQSQRQPQPEPQSKSESESAPAPDSTSSANPDEKPSVQRPSIRLPQKRGARIALIVGAAVLVVAIVAAALFAWNRWYRFDDHADMQGTWYVVGTTVPVTIDETSIHLKEDVTYQYEINAHDKTISYKFGTMEGQGRYWFSDDRQYLVITDGDEFTGTSTAVDDLLHAFTDLTNRATGAGLKLPEGEGIIAFSREPDADALARQQAEAASKEAAEAAERKAAEEEAARIAAEEAAEAAAWEEYYEEEQAEESSNDESSNDEPSNEEAPTDEEPSEGEASTDKDNEEA